MANPLLDFAQKRTPRKSDGLPGATPETNPLLQFAQKVPVSKNITLPNSAGSNPLLDFADAKDTPDMGSGSTALNQVLGEDAQYAPRTVDDARALQKKDPTIWQRLSKNLMKPVGVVATLAEETGNAIGSLAVGDAKGSLSAIVNAPSKVGGIITGTRERSFSDIWREDAKEFGLSEGAAGWIGTIIDIAADPLNVIGGGLTKLGVVSSKVSALTKAGETIKVGSKLHKEMKAMGFADDMFELAATKAEQVQKGQRALLTLFSGTRFEKVIVKGASVYQTTAKLKTGFQATRLSTYLNKVFSTKTSNEAFNVAKNHAENLLEYRRGQVMDEALDLQKTIGEFTQEEALRVIDVIETGKQSGIAAIDDVAKRFKTNFDALRKSEESLGLLKTTIDDYFPHIRVKEKLPIKDRIARMIFDPKKWKTALGSSKERQILRFVSETGEEQLVGKASQLGLRKLNSEALIRGVEAHTAKTTTHLQSLQKALAKPEIKARTEDLRAIIKELRANLDEGGKIIKETLDEPTAAEFGKTIDSIVGLERQKLTDLILDLEQRVLTSGGGEFIEGAAKVSKKASRAAKIVDLEKRIKEIQNIAADKIKKLQFFEFAGKEGKFFKAIKKEGEFMGAGKATVREINEIFGTEFFEQRPAIAFAERALASAKAVTSKEFFESIKSFAVKEGDEFAETAIEVTAKELKGMKFMPDIARQIDDYARALKPEELNIALRQFDAVQNWWKAQALVAPSYHIRNMAGNLWNNFLAGVKNPRSYFEAGQVQLGKPVEFVDDAGRVWNNTTIMKAARQTGVVNEGWYAKDIATRLGSEFEGLSWNPLKQNFGLYRGNRAVGSAMENNARLAHFIEKLKSGESIDIAAASVKKYLFDYGDLTTVEKQVFKRFVPFYTWTRKNIPLQFEKLLTEPAKFAGVAKVIKGVEAGVEEPNEKYLGDYIRDNVGIRVGNDDKGNTYYFLLGNWLPAAQAIDFISQPTQNFIAMISPFFKTPVELWANQSTFFEDTFGQPSKIERYPEENQSFLGLTMRKKTAYILKNIRVLNELDKLNPGAIFGDKDNPSILNRIAPEAGFRLGKVGTITTAGRQRGRFTPEIAQKERVLQSLFGKSVPYNPAFARKFYLWDTETKVRELERSIKDAQRDGQKEYAKRLRMELNKVKKTR